MRIWKSFAKISHEYRHILTSFHPSRYGATCDNRKMVSKPSGLMICCHVTGHAAVPTMLLRGHQNTVLPENVIIVRSNAVAELLFWSHRVSSARHNRNSPQRNHCDQQRWHLNTAVREPKMDEVMLSMSTHPCQTSRAARHRMSHVPELSR
jgi:hypothetical protein